MNSVRELSDARFASFHSLPLEDVSLAYATRAASAARKELIPDENARPMFDALMAAVPNAEDVAYDPGKLGGIPGWWCRPKNAHRDRRLLFLHGGGYILGSATAFRAFAGQFASMTRSETFIPEYRRAPENPFPAAIEDTMAAYRALANECCVIGLIGDSAGGGLALSLLSLLAKQGAAITPCCAAVMSPWTDLAMTGETMATRAEADPIFTPAGLGNFARLYLHGHDAQDPRASPIYADHRHLPPIRIDVGDDEILLSDSVRYARAAYDNGAGISLHIWLGMPHVVPSKFDKFTSSKMALAGIGAFLNMHLERADRLGQDGGQRSHPARASGT